MPHDPVLVGLEVVKTSGLHEITIEQRYEAPAGPDSEIAFDEFKDQDAALAANVMKWLNREYPGHLWGVVADLRHGIVKFNIPVLMGFNQWWVVNLRTHDIIDGIRAGSGQILERYQLSRTRFNLGEFLDARAQHSILVNPARKVPD